MRYVIAATVIATGVFAHAPVGAQPPPADSTLPEALFDVHSNFWVNLHQFLYVKSRLALGIELKRPSVLGALADTVARGILSDEARRGWEHALAYYERSVARRDVVFDSTLVAVNDRLAELPDDGSGEPSGADSGIAGALRAAAPAYRQVWWTRHDAANRHWATSVEHLIAQYGDSMAVLQMKMLDTHWPTTPIRVDVTAYATWAGAYTTIGPAHITIASVDPLTQGNEGFETIFHESMHTMDGPLHRLIRTDARAMRKAIPRDPTHPFIFFTAGELTKRFFPGHVPYAEETGIWSRVPAFARAYSVLRREWIPYLEGRTTLEDAVKAIVATWDPAPRRPSRPDTLPHRR